MNLTDTERRKFAAYCKHIAKMERLVLEQKEKLFKQHRLRPELQEYMLFHLKKLIAAYLFVAADLAKWDEAETVSAKDVGEMENE